MTNKALYKCPICGLHYENAEEAKLCQAYCQQFHGCSLEITKLSVERRKVIMSSQSRSKSSE